MTALSFPTSSPAARVFAALPDLGQMHRVLSLALDSLTEHLTIVNKDLQVLDDNILQTGLVL